MPVDHIARLPAKISPDQGACLGIPGITAHRAVHVAGPVAGRTILVQGAGGSVGLCAVALARFAGTTVIGTVRSSSEEETARAAGAQHVFFNDSELKGRLKSIAPEGLDHIVEVAFAANIDKDVEILKQGGSIATYAADKASPTIPFWQMVFKNTRVFFLAATTSQRKPRWPPLATSIAHSRLAGPVSPLPNASRWPILREHMS